MFSKVSVIIPTDKQPHLIGRVIWTIKLGGRSTRRRGGKKNFYDTII